MYPSMTNFNCRTPAVSLTSFEYLFISRIVIWTVISSLKLDFYQILVKFGCPGQQGNPFFSAQSVFVMFEPFLVPNMC